MNRKQQEAVAALTEMRKLLVAWLRGSEESREPVARMLELLEPVEAAVRGTSVEKASGPDTAGPSYKVEKKRNADEVLTEFRDGGSTPYRCPKYLYDATVKVLDKSDPALAFEEIVERVGRDVPEPSGWQVRVVLRFLAGQQPPLIVKERNRYRPLRQASFDRDAQLAWKALSNAR